MRLHFNVILFVTMGVSALGQTYTISTIAGTGAGIGDGGPATAAQLRAGGVAVDTQNNIFVLDDNRVRRIDRSSVITTFFAREPHNLLATLASDAAGNIYVGDPQNPTLKLSPDGTISTIPTVSNISSALLLDGQGNFYAIGNNQFVAKITPDGKQQIVAGEFPDRGFSGDGGPATQATLCGATGLALDSKGNLFISETTGNRIRKVTPAGIISTIAGSTTVADNGPDGCNGVSGSSGDGGPAIAALLSFPGALAIDSQDNLYVLDQANNMRVIRKITPNQVITHFATISLTSSQVTSPYLNGMTFDNHGNLLVASDDVWSVIPTGGVTKIAGIGTCCADKPAAGAAARSAILSAPLSAAADGFGSVYFGDNRGLWKVQNGTISQIDTNSQTRVYVASDHAGTVYFVTYDFTNLGFIIKKIGPGGTIANFAGTGKPCLGGISSGDGGPATAANLCSPQAPSVDVHGNFLFIEQQGAPRVRRVDTNGIITTVAAGSGNIPYVEGGSALSANLVRLTGVAADGTGNIYLTDAGGTGNISRLLKITPDGTIHSIPGNADFRFPVDGAVGTDINISFANGVAVSESGDVYFSIDGAYGTNNNEQVVQMLPDGTIRIIAGGKGIQNARGLGDGGPAAEAGLSSPSGLDVDRSGNIYVADSGDNRIRLLTPSASSCTYLVAWLDFNPTILEIGQPAGNITVNIQTAAGCSWAVSGLPDWLRVVANGSGTGPAVITLGVTANPGGPRTGTISIAGVSIQMRQDGAILPLTITTASPLLPAATGLAYSQTLAVSGGVAPYAWATISGSLPSGLTLSAAGTITGTPSTAATSTFTVKVTDSTSVTATQTYSLTVVSAGTPVRSGSLAHIAAGGGWSTLISLVNTSPSPVALTIVLHGDTGSALSLPLTTTQQGVTQTTTAALVNSTLNPNTTLLISTGDQSASTVVGWADVLSSGSVNGFAIFRSSPQTGVPSEGTVPLQTQFPSAIILPYDNTAGFATGAALANLSTASVNITATIWDDNGNLLGSPAMTVAGSGHASFLLPNQFQLTSGKRGIVRFQSSGSSAITGLGLRFSPFGTFTSVPTILGQ